MPTSSRISLPVSARLCAASANSAALPVSTAATVLTTAIAALAPSAARTERVGSLCGPSAIGARYPGVRALRRAAADVAPPRGLPNPCVDTQLAVGYQRPL